MTKPSIPHPWRGGRGPRRFGYTYADLAKLYGVSVSTIMHWCSRLGKQPAKLNPADLRSIIDLHDKRRSA